MSKSHAPSTSKRARPQRGCLHDLGRTTTSVDFLPTVGLPCSVFSTDAAEPQTQMDPMSHNKHLSRDQVHTSLVARNLWLGSFLDTTAMHSPE